MPSPSPVPARQALVHRPAPLVARPALIRYLLPVATRLLGLRARRSW